MPLPSNTYENLGLKGTDIALTYSLAAIPTEDPDPEDPQEYSYSGEFGYKFPLQANGPIPPRRAENPQGYAGSPLAIIPPKENQRRLLELLTFGEEPGEDPVTSYPLAHEKYKIMATEAPIGAALLVATFRIDENTTTEPLFTVVTAPSASYKGTPQTYDDISAFDPNDIPALADPSRQPTHPCFPLMCTVWTSSRNPNLSSLKDSFISAADSHLFSLKGQKLFRTAIIQASTDAPDPPAPFDGWLQNFWLGTLNETTAFVTGDHPLLNPDDAVLAIPAQPSANARFHLSLTAIPLPPNHGFPAGVLVPTSKNLSSMKALVRELLPAYHSEQKQHGYLHCPPQTLRPSFL